MFKNGDLIKEARIEKDEVKTLDLGRLYPLGKLETNHPNFELDYSYDNIHFTHLEDKSSFNDESIRYIKFSNVQEDLLVKIYCGLGYIAEVNQEFEQHFIKKSHWSGADGIYSFNLEEKEYYDQKNDKTLFVFGDTFVGQVKGNRRMEPTSMVNNSFAYFKDNQMDFRVGLDENNGYKSFFLPSNDILERGYTIQNLKRYYGKDIYLKPYLSSNKKDEDIEIIFTFPKEELITEIKIENYHDEPSFDLGLEKRGVKELDLYYLDNNEYKLYRTLYLELYSKDKELNIFNDLDIKSKSIKFIIKKSKNLNDKLVEDDNCLGLKKVYFYSSNNLLDDLEVSTSSQYEKEYSKSWLWLQDGIVINDKFYIFPCLIDEDLSQVEGYQFKMTGVTRLEIPLINQELDYKNYKIKEVPFFKRSNSEEILGPIAIFYNHERYLNSDNYVYFYFYKNYTQFMMRSLLVGRIKDTDIDDLNNLEYFNGKEWVTNIEEAKPLLDHVSCEMSIQKIEEGENKGKVLAIFQYDTNSHLVSYSIGESLVGPFTSPRICHVIDNTIYNSPTTYSYNAKSHLHLSSKTNILVSYNLNDMSMKKNKEEYSIYHPRFLNLLDTSKDENK